MLCSSCLVLDSLLHEDIFLHHSCTDCLVLLFWHLFGVVHSLMQLLSVPYLPLVVVQTVPLLSCAPSAHTGFAWLMCSFA